MKQFTSAEVDIITSKCLDLYQKLPKNGKPIENEWTVLSCIVQFDTEFKSFEVVSLGTGSKCIGASKMSPSGFILNDGHAEVIARRGFIVYLYENIEKAIQNEKSIFTFANNKFNLSKNIQFILYSSQLPCGDASIIPKCTEDNDVGDILVSKKRLLDNDDDELKKSTSDGIIDIFRTGAKCLPDSLQDSKDIGINYHVIGQVRTKPGRGDRTLSVSCSDKIAKWIHMGIQGSLLDILLDKPLYVNHLIFGAGTPYSEETLTRAFFNRNNTNITPDVKPEFYQSSLPFLNRKTASCLRPSHGSIVWINSDKEITEVSVQGIKLGATKKTSNVLKNSLVISKYNIYRRFINIMQKIKDTGINIINDDTNLNTISYNAMKKKSKLYYEKWLSVKNNFFTNWTVKPDMWDFCII